MRQIEEFKLVAAQAGEARLKAEQVKKNALDQLYVLRQEAEIQREDLYSAEAETKKAWKIVGEANSKVSAQAKELKEAQDSKAEMVAKIATLQRSLDQSNASSKFGSIERSRLETEISTLSRRLKTQQEQTQRAETDLAAKCKELGKIKLHDSEASLAKIATLTDQKEKLEATLRDWQARHSDIASRLDVSEAHRSRAVLEIEDLVSMLFAIINYRIMNLLDLNRSATLLSDLP
jgi:chromosome segregation ATPase